MSPDSPRSLGDCCRPGVLICCCKLSSANTWASLVMQPRCEHLKSLIVSGQEFKSEGRDLAWPHWKSAHSPRGGPAEVAQAGTTQLHTKPGAQCLSLPYSSEYLLLFFFFSFAVFPLVLLSFPPLSKAALLCPRTVSGHSEVALSFVFLGAENSLR